MKRVIPANAGRRVIFADMQAIREVVATCPDGSIGQYVGCQSIDAWEVEGRNLLPLTYDGVDLQSDRFRYVTTEESDPQVLEAKRRKFAMEIYSEVTNEKGVAQ